MQHIVAFLSFSRVISTDKISAQLSMHLDFSGRYLYCKDSLMYKTTPPPFLFNLEQVKISYPASGMDIGVEKTKLPNCYPNRLEIYYLKIALRDME